MSTALMDLLFWIVVLVVLFVVIRYAQNRRKKGPDDTD